MVSYFAEALKSIMNEMNLNQSKLARVLDICQSQISNWLSGKTQPNYCSIDLLCKKLNIDCASLFIKK